MIQVESVGSLLRRYPMSIEIRLIAQVFVLAIFNQGSWYEQEQKLAARQTMRGSVAEIRKIRGICISDRLSSVGLRRLNPR